MFNVEFLTSIVSRSDITEYKTNESFIGMYKEAASVQQESNQTCCMCRQLAGEELIMTARIHMLSASLAADHPLPNDVWAGLQ